MENIIKILLTGIFSVFKWTIEVIFEYLGTLIAKERKTEFNADFMSQEEQAELYSSSENGFTAGDRSISVLNSTKNAIVYGSTGSNKSVGVLLPSIYKMRKNCSLIITDFSTELLQKGSGALIDAGFENIKVISLGKPHASDGYNPLSHVHSVSDVQKLTKMIISAQLGSGGKDPFWNLAAEGVCNVMATYLIRYTAPEYRTLHNLYRLVSAIHGSPEAIDRLVVKTGDQVLISEYKNIISYDKILSSVIAVCRAALSIYGTDPDVALTTSFNTINIDEFRKTRAALFITINTSDMKYYSSLTSIVLSQLFGEIMSKLPSEHDIPIFSLIDEASSLYFPSIQIILSNIRKYKSGILQIYQSVSQPVDLYSPQVAKAINENSFLKVYLPGQPISVSQELSQTLGQFEYTDEKDVRRTRPLMTADEIRTSESLIFIGNRPAIHTKIRPYFEQKKMVKLSQLPPYVPANKLPFTTPPILQL